MTAKKTKGSPWIAKATAAIEMNLYEDHRRVTGETVRNWLRRRRMRKPDHHNAYGALIRIAVQRGLLRPTGEFARMEAPTSHRRITPVYRVKKPKTA